MERIRIYEIPEGKMVASECGMFGDEKLEQFSDWMDDLPRTMFPQDFLSFDEECQGFIWYYRYQTGMFIPNGLKLIDFPGGLYAVVTAVDGDDYSEAISQIKQFIEESDFFEEDSSRKYLGNIITSPTARQIMGYNQMDHYIPIRPRE